MAETLVMNQPPIEEALRDLPRTGETKRLVLEWLHFVGLDFHALERWNPSAIDLEGVIDGTLDWNSPKHWLGPSRYCCCRNTVKPDC